MEKIMLILTYGVCVFRYDIQLLFANQVKKPIQLIQLNLFSTLNNFTVRFLSCSPLLHSVVVIVANVVVIVVHFFVLFCFNFSFRLFYTIRCTDVILLYLNSINVDNKNVHLCYFNCYLWCASRRPSILCLYRPIHNQKNYAWNIYRLNSLLLLLDFF